MKTMPPSRKALPSASGSPRLLHPALALVIISSAAAVGFMVASSQRSGITPEATVSPSTTPRHETSALPLHEPADAAAPSAPVKLPTRTSAAAPTTEALLLTLSQAPASDEAFQATVRLANQGPASLKAILEALRTARTPEEARLLATALAMNGSGDAVEGLIQQVIAVTDPAKRTAMLEGLNNLTQPEGVTLLASAFSTTDNVEVLQAASAVIARAAVPDTVDYLVEIYGEAPRFQGQQEQVLSALRGIQNPAALPALTATAGRTDAPELSSAAMASLAKLGTAEAVLALRQAYEMLHAQAPESDQSVRLLETFQGIPVTAQILPMIATMAENGPSPAWAEAARQMLAQAGNVSANAVSSNGSVAQHYRPVGKNRR